MFIRQFKKSLPLNQVFQEVHYLFFLYETMFFEFVIDIIVPQFTKYLYIMSNGYITRHKRKYVIALFIPLKLDFPIFMSYSIFCFFYSFKKKKKFNIQSRSLANKNNFIRYQLIQQLRDNIFI